MKIHCECGKILHDQADNLPHMAHFIPDEDWLGVLEAMDQVVSDVAARRLTVEAAQMAVRRVQVQASRHMYQCDKCGRLFVDDRQRNANIYDPVSDKDSKQILRGRDQAA